MFSICSRLDAFFEIQYQATATDEQTETILPGLLITAFADSLLKIEDILSNSC